MLTLGTIPERLDRVSFTHDDEVSHIEVDQDAARKTGAGALLERICPAHVYRVKPDGTVGIEYAACLECGTCLAIAPPGVVRWRYPRGGFGVAFREG
ncbi:MAG: 4Fe-4S dicluster domain-containing protein [Actinomycetia bacterium]|nr:4Fe-4S dicluster domain-containing protein [Actinomycetes bacterium]